MFRPSCPDVGRTGSLRRSTTQELASDAELARRYAFAVVRWAGKDPACRTAIHGDLVGRPIIHLLHLALTGGLRAADLVRLVDRVGHVHWMVYAGRGAFSDCFGSGVGAMRVLRAWREATILEVSRPG